jgi:hypothetical protein
MGRLVVMLVIVAACGGAGRGWTQAPPADDASGLWLKVQASPLAIEDAAIRADADARWTAYLGAQQGAMDAALADADRRSGGRPLGPEAAQTNDGLGSSWSADRRELQVILVRKTVRSSVLLERRDGGGCSKRYPPGGAASFPEERGELVACPPPRHENKMHVRAYAMHVGLVLRYRADGTLIAARAYAPHAVPGTGPY